MQRIWGLLIVTACSDSGGGADLDAPTGGDGPPAAIDASPGVGEPAELMGITLLHNQIRAAVVTSTPLPALQWDPSLAATAAAWVAMCRNTDSIPQIMDHNPGRSAGHPYQVGENIFASGASATPQGALNSWGAEKPNYNAATGACSGSCGHYTQVVWRTTLKLGCALGTCPGIQFPSTIVCNYGPAGNSGGLAY